jgi:hypothetical protein
MSIRPARRSDLTAIAKLCADAFYDDELFGALMHPYREQFLGDYEAYFTRRMRQHWWDYSHIWFVATVLKQGEEVIVGVAEWEFMGDVGKKLRLQPWDPRKSSLDVILRVQ